MGQSPAMIGTTPTGVRVAREPAPTRWSRRSFTGEELTGSPRADRDFIIVAMTQAHGWSPARVAAALGLKRRRAQQILREFRDAMGGRAG